MEILEREGASTSMHNLDERSAGGKLKKSKRPPATPYARPLQPWLSKLVAPARHLISGIPSFFSKSRSDDGVYREHNQNPDKLKAEETVHSDKILGSTITEKDAKSSEEVETQSGIQDSAIISDQIKHEQQSVVDLSRPIDFNEIERLVSSKRFSRDDVQRLVGVLRSRTIDSNETTQGGATPDETMLLRPQSSYIGDSSPVELARAYMKNRISEASPSSRHFSIEGNARSNEVPRTPLNPATCWPGAHSQEICHDMTPRSERRCGLSSSQRTPYSKSIYSQTKSKLLQVQSVGRRNLDLTSTPDKIKAVTDKGISPVSVFHGSGSFGPIRRTRHHHPSVENISGFRRFRLSNLSPAVQDSSKPSPASISGMSKNVAAQKSISSNGLGTDGNSQISRVGVPPHSSHLARRILEHLDRNPSTPKDKAAELKQATLWRRSATDATEGRQFEVPLSNNAGAITKDSDVKFWEPSQENELQNANSGIKLPQFKSATVSDVSAVSKLFENRSSEVTAKTGSCAEPSLLPKAIVKQTDASSVDQHSTPKKPPIPGSKPLLPAIAINKRVPIWALPSDNGVGFTFPVSASSGTLHDLPTPSISPSTSGINLENNGLPAPSYSFCMKKSASLVFSFPSISHSLDQTIVAAEVNFSFGSDTESRISFTSIGNDSVCC